MRKSLQLLTIGLVFMGVLAVGAETAEASEIAIRARGRADQNCAGTWPKMQLKVNGGVKKTWNVLDGWANYVYSQPGNININQLSVAFTNDCHPRRDLIVDYVVLDSVRYDSEASSVRSTGTWTPGNRCGPGFKESQWLHCNGELQFGQRDAQRNSEITNNCNCSITSVSDTTPNEGDQITLTGSASGLTGTVTYKWDWDGDGTMDDTTNNTNIDHTYSGISSDQTYTVKLSVEDDNGNSADNCDRQDITVTAFSPITGTVYEDTNLDLVCSEGATFGGTADIMVNGSDHGDYNGSVSSTYTTIQEYSRTQINKTLRLDNISGSYYELTGERATYDHGGTQVGGAAAGGYQVDFCVSANPNAWFQVEDGDVYGGSISIEIPATKYFMTGEQGPILTSNLSNLGPGGLQEGRSNPWLDDSYSVNAPSYNDFEEIYATRIANGDLQQNSGMTGGNAPQNGPDNGKVFFVDGDLEFTNDFDGGSVFFVSGTTTIKSGVDDSINAAIISEGNIVIEESGNDAILEITGMAVSLSGNIQINRTKNNNQDPAVKFNYDPSYLINFTDKLGRSRIKWHEIAP